MTVKGEPILEVPVRDRLDTGIDYEVLYPGLVPFIEEREAARFNGYTWKTYESLPRVERVYSVAYWRMTHVIDGHRNDAVARDAERRARHNEVRRGA